MLTGATRLNIIVGDPIAQVKSPSGFADSFAARGHDGIVVPVQVAAADLPGLLAVCDRLENLDGIVVTIPHKFACYGHCATVTDRVRTLGVVNIMRRNPDRSWHGEMVDGLGFLAAVRSRGGQPEGKRVLLVGAGGAGSAIGLAFIEAGAAELAVHDGDAARRDALVARLAALGRARVLPGSADPAGFDIVANASPAGMRDGDPLPVDASRLGADTFVGCVITAPAISPIVAAARARGCRTSTGTDMFHGSLETMVDFLLGPAA